ncbi:MAG: PKD domain-containing protein, partial [Acidimicrobiales bacterium]
MAVTSSVVLATSLVALRTPRLGWPGAGSRWPCRRRVCGANSPVGCCSTAGAAIVHVDWSWGDGTTSVSFFPALHTYAAPGSYRIIAVAVDSDGLTGSAATDVRVVAPPTVARISPAVGPT